MRSLAVDVGGTRIKIASLRDGAVERMTMIPACSEGRLRDRLEDIARALEQVAERSIEAFDGLGMALPCLVDPAAGRATEIYGKFEDAPEVDLAAWCRERLGLPLAVEQDSKAALLGEVRFGCARGAEDAVMLIMGTGVGTAVMRRGRLADSRRHFAGALGSHIIVDAFQGRICACGTRGCLEAYTAGWALPGLIREQRTFPSSPLAREERLDYAALGRALAEDDDTARRVLDTVVRALRAGIISLIHAYDPDTVILSGGPLRLGDAFTEPLLQDIGGELWGRGHEVAFRVAKQPEQSVLLGLHYLTTMQRSKP